MRLNSHRLFWSIGNWINKTFNFKSPPTKCQNYSLEKMEIWTLLGQRFVCRSPQDSGLLSHTFCRGGHEAGEKQTGAWKNLGRRGRMPVFCIWLLSVLYQYQDIDGCPASHIIKWVLGLELEVSEFYPDISLFFHRALPCLHLLDVYKWPLQVSFIIY